MERNKIIVIISIVLTVLVIAIAGVLIFNKNNQTLKTATTSKGMVAGENNDVKETDNGVVEESAEPSEEPSASPTPEFNPVGKYYIKVNNQMNTITIYTKDSNGNYTIPVRAMICSTGQNTPKNSKYQTKGKWNWGALFHDVYGQYCTHITGDYLFHSVPYLAPNNNQLSCYMYDQLGTTCSMGCVRLTTADAKWIYDNCATGTTVEFYNSSNPGPLGKPTAMKISGYPLPLRAWDPTDPNPNNPWIEYFRTGKVPTTTNTTTTTTTPSAEPAPSVEPSVAPTPSVVPTVTATQNNETPTQVAPTTVPTQTSTNPITIVTSSEPSTDPTE